MLWLRDLFLHYVGEQAQLYTTDECDVSYLKCGQIPNVYSTTDFAAIVNGKIKLNHSIKHNVTCSRLIDLVSISINITK